MAPALGSGDVPVLGTPRLVALCEAATVDAVVRALEPGETTVGTRVELDHLRASGFGARVEAHAMVVAAEGRHIVFEVSVSDESGVVARGKITRVRVDRARFLDGVT